MSDTVTPDELEVMLRGRNSPRVIDVRRKADYQNDPSMIPGAEWKDPEKADEWAKELTGQTAIIYCVRGGSVSKATLEKLQGQKINARYIEGGIEAWSGSGRPVTGKENI